MRIGIIVAMDKEFTQLKTLLIITTQTSSSLRVWLEALTSTSMLPKW